MTKVLLIICLLVGLGISVSLFPEGMGAVLLCLICSFFAAVIISRYEEEKEFLLQIFLIALLIRVLVGTMIYTFGATGFLGNDAETYDFLGNRLLEIWQGLAPVNDGAAERAMLGVGSGWGMNYLVAVIYFLFGRNMLAGQFFSSVIGAATAPAIYICAYLVFHNKRVAKTSAIIVAVFPSLVLWSCQMMKDGYIIFLLVLIMIAVLQLQKKFNYLSLIVLIFSLFGIMSFRFYIFYMVAVAVVGSFVIGLDLSPQATFRRLTVIILVGLGMTYLGVLRDTSVQIENFGSLDRVQFTRQNLATDAESGFGKDLDVSTTEGAIEALPVGFIYLMLAPFPWEIKNLRQAITLPEMFLWWASLPLLIIGLWYTIKNRLRNAIAILLFTFMLTIAYSIFQGNVGTAYRQRAQIQVFLFIFVAVGWSLMIERKENRKLQMRKSINKISR